MPIDYSKYPPNWETEIRPRILERDGHKCKECKVPNYAYRNNKTGEWTLNEMQAETWACVDEAKVVRIILTIAHANDPDPMNCQDDNLAALCQRCHNQLDANMRARNRRAKSIPDSQQSIFVEGV